MTSEIEIKIPVLRNPVAMQDWSNSRIGDGRTIGCVPTMGALHEGHLSLIRKCAEECDETIVTIFVNPLQFAPNEDLDKYPRDEESDLKLALQAGATAAYCPSVETMYPADRSVFIDESAMSKVLCGKTRPRHFSGVLTVVAKLFNACVPDRAYFGEKDYQQLLLIKKMVRELDFPVEIIHCPIIREPDGLAMSSRNKYLDDNERKQAVCLYNALKAAEKAFNDRMKNPREIEKIAFDIISQADSARIDYIECRDAVTLDDIEIINRPALLALAVFIGKTRLIDNIVLIPETEN